MAKRVSLALALVVAMAGCGQQAPLEGGRQVASLTPAQEAGILALVNDCSVGLDALDVDAGLDARAANGIIAHRNGADGVCGTGDDDRFDSLAELDAVSYVGDSAIQKLLAFATLQGYVNEGGGGEIVGYFDGVAFTAAEIEGVLAIANGASLELLDNEVGLDARAASGIVAARPFANMETLAAVPYVGASALESLKAYIPSWQPQSSGCPAVGGTFEGVTFTDRQAADVLDLANRGDSGALDAISGIGPTLAGRIVAARPFAGIAELGAVSGIGGTVLTALRDEVATSWCTTGASACGCTGGSTGGGTGETQTHDGVEFSAAEAAAALAILNQASEGQLRADGQFTGAITAKILGGRTWASLADFAATSGIGGATMEQLRAYASNGLWSGPGPIRTAVTVAQLVANPGAYLGKFVSFNVVIAKTEGGPMQSLASVADSAGATSWLRLKKYLCDPITENCVPPPAIDSGDRLTLIHVRVDTDYDGFYLRMVDTTAFEVLGCSEGWVKACGFDQGVCSPGTQTCSSDTWSECTGLVERMDTDPADGLDNDCDGLVDENAESLTELGHLAGLLKGFAPNGSGSIAASDTEYLRIDVSNPANLRVLERRARPEGAVGMVTVRSVAGSTLVADCRIGLSVYPSDAVGLEATMSVPASGGCLRDSDRSGTQLIASDWYNGVKTFDVSGSSPVQSVTLPVVFPRRARLRQGHVIALGNAFEVHKVGSGSSSLVQSFPLVDYPRDMELSDGGIAAVTTTGAMLLFDVSNPAAPVQLPSFNISAWQLAFSGTRLAVVSSGADRLLSVIDLSNPSAPQICAQTAVPTHGGPDGSLDGVAFQGDVIYVWSEAGLHSYSVGSGCGG